MIKKEFKVSIIIPIYNAEKYLLQCLHSVVNQTLKDIEIICVNDGSTDGSLEIINEYARNDHRIIVIDKVNTGYGSSMNCGIKIARGEFLGIVESDDYVDSNMFEQLYNLAKGNSAQIVKSNCWQHTDGEDDTFVEFFKDNTYDKIIVPSDEKEMLCRYINLWSGIYNIDFLRDNDISFNESPGASYQDIGFTMKVMMCADRVYLTPKAYYHYRIDNPDSSVKSNVKVYCVSEEYKEVWRFLKSRADIYDRYCCNVPYIQFLRYIETFRRIDNKYRIDFFIRTIEDFNALDMDGVLREDKWPQKEWNVLSDILGKAARDYEKYSLTVENQNKIISSPLDLGYRLAKASSIYIYGAGKIGIQVAEILKSYYNCDFTGFAVTDTDDNPRLVKDKPVICYKELAKMDPAPLILISVGRSSEMAILRLLRLQGYWNIILMNPYTREMVRTGMKDVIENMGKEFNAPGWDINIEITKYKWW